MLCNKAKPLWIVAALIKDHFADTGITLELLGEHYAISWERKVTTSMKAEKTVAILQTLKKQMTVQELTEVRRFHQRALCVLFTEEELQREVAMFIGTSKAGLVCEVESQMNMYADRLATSLVEIGAEELAMHRFQDTCDLREISRRLRMHRGESALPSSKRRKVDQQVRADVDMDL